MDNRNYQYWKAYVANQGRAMCFHINAILEEDDPEVALVHIQAMEEIDKQVYEVFPYMGTRTHTIRQSILEGVGDVAKLREKCLALGVLDLDRIVIQYDGLRREITPLYKHRSGWNRNWRKDASKTILAFCHLREAPRCFDIAKITYPTFETIHALFESLPTKAEYMMNKERRNGQEIKDSK